MDEAHAPTRAIRGQRGGGEVMDALVRRGAPLAQDAHAIHGDVDAVERGVPAAGHSQLLEAHRPESDAHVQRRCDAGDASRIARSDDDVVTAGGQRRDHVPAEETGAAQH
jgi:hypothetical protein